MRFENVKAQLVLKLNATRNATLCKNCDDLLLFSFILKIVIFSVVYI